MIYIGIDPGVDTGIAVWDSIAKQFLSIDSMKIHQAMKRVVDLSTTTKIFVRIEDSRKRKWYGMRSVLKMQGAGSIKRDCKIWEDFLTDYNIDFEMIHPIRHGTKLNAQRFIAFTKYQGRTNEHSRDAAMMVFKK